MNIQKGTIYCALLAEGAVGLGKTGRETKKFDNFNKLFDEDEFYNTKSGDG